jgi:hypothetical protein
MFLALSCNNVVKKNHLPEKQMQEILLDIQLAEAYNALLKPDSSATPNKPIKNIDSLAGYYKIILSQHKVSYSQFKESMDWYRQNPDRLDSIYTHIQPLLGKMKM